MLFIFECSGCRTRLEAETQTAGTTITCPKCRASIIVPRSSPGPGVTIGGFRIEKLLGKGGMGEVYLARQLSLDRLVALKILPSRFSADREMADRFLQELRVLARLDHPNIVAAYEAGQDNNILFLAMSYVKGDSLETRLHQQGALSEKEALDITIKLVSALSYSWKEYKLLHRDIKPSNILMDANGEPKLVDMGLAKSLAHTDGLTMSGTVMGTPNYMSPEQAEGEKGIDCRADMYSLGATLYHMVTGQMPFAGSSIMDVLKKQAMESLPDPRDFTPSISENCVTLLEIMLAKDPAQRHDSWEALMGDLKRVAAGKTPTQQPLALGESALLRVGAPNKGKKRIIIHHPVAQPSPTQHPPPTPKEPSAAPMIVGLSIAAIVIGLGIWFGLRSHTEKPAPIAAISEPAPPSDDKKLVALKDAYTEALQYSLAHPGDHAGVMKRFMMLKQQAAGTDFEAKVAEQLHRLSGLETKKIEEAIAAFKREIYDLVAREKFEEAQQRLLAPGGPYAAQLTAASVELKKMVNDTLAEATAKKAEVARRKEAQAKQMEAQKAATQRVEAQKHFTELLDDVARKILAGDVQAAQTQLSVSANDAALKSVAAEIGNSSALLAKLAALPDRIMASFEQDIGKNISLDLRNGTQVKVQVIGVKGHTLRAVQVFSSGHVELHFTPSDLSLREKARRLGTEQTPEMALMRGMFAVEGRDMVGAERHFTDAGNAIGAALVRVLSHTKIEQLEGPARQALASLLKVAGVTNDISDPAKFATAISAKEYSTNRAAKIQQAVTEFQSRYGQTMVAKSNAPILAALTAINSPTVIEQPALSEASNQESPVALKEATPETVKQTLAKLQADNRGVKTNSISCTLNGNAIYVILGPGVSDIRALQGIPVVNLRLDHANVINIRPIHGMPLRELLIRSSPISDLRPLTGMPLEKLYIVVTKIKDLKPLVGLPLTYLQVYDSPVSDLSPLKDIKSLNTLLFHGVPIKNISPFHDLNLVSVEITGCAIADLTPLKGMQSLERLNLQGNPQLNDLSPLQGMTSLKYLDLLDTPIKTIAPLKGLPLTFLRLSRTKITDLTPLAEMPLRDLYLDGTLVSDLAPLKEMASLATLSIINTPVSDLTVIATLTRLNKLALGSGAIQGIPEWNTSVTPPPQRSFDLAPLKDLSLTSLTLAGVKIKTLKPLENMPINELQLLDVRIDNLQELPECLPRVERLTVGGETERLKEFDNSEFLLKFPSLKTVNFMTFRPKPINVNELRKKKAAKAP